MTKEKFRTLRGVFQDQASYNQKIRDMEPQRSASDWTQTYLLGLVSEMDEVLREINWKRNRNGKHEENLENIAGELADLTKFVFSLWELWGFTPDTMLQYIDDKTEVLNQQLKQEFAPTLEDRNVILTDIDGTLGDWRLTFIRWMEHKYGKSFDADPGLSLMTDQDLSMRYSDYYNLKEEFEAEGMYRYIEPYPDSVRLLQCAKEGSNPAYIIAFTARPASRYKRIWLDTWRWFQDNDIKLDELHIGSEPRLLMANNIRSKCKVLMLEDDPGLALRAANLGIQVMLRDHPYNQGIQHDNIARSGTYDLNTSWFFGE